MAPIPELFDHYEICFQAGAGGTGTAYCALDTQTGCKVALKIPHRSVVLDVILYEQFLREQDAMTLLHHPGVQRGLKSGHYNGTPYLVTAWIEGQSLNRRLKNGEPMPLERAIPIITQVAEGLLYCHAQGVIHRDIKPDNILLGPDDTAVIVDFGLALTPTRPGTGKAVGTLGFAAPEQIEDYRADVRADIYGLGATFYALLTGHPPFKGEDMEDVITQARTQALPRLDHVDSQISQQVATVVARCLQYDPARRYASVQAFLDDLNNLESVETEGLDELTAVPPGRPFLQTQAGQVVLLLSSIVGGMIVLTLLAVIFKP